MLLEVGRLYAIEDIFWIAATKGNGIVLKKGDIAMFLAKIADQANATTPYAGGRSYYFVGKHGKFYDYGSEFAMQTKVREL